MTLVVETGAGANPLANSYASLAEATAYVADMPAGLRAPWNALAADTDRESLLIFATRVLEQRASFNGSKTLSSSPLRWPRMNVFDCDDLPIANDVLPSGLKAATIELAVFYATPGRGPAVYAENDGLKRLVVDVMEFEWKDDYKPSNSLRFPAGLNSLLCGLGRIQTGRAGFVPIKKV